MNEIFLNDLFRELSYQQKVCGSTIGVTYIVGCLSKIPITLPELIEYVLHIFYQQKSYKES